ncbi:MAG: YMGG-like glycine zipper-containing protein [Ginsengibacter sp.]
MNKKLHPTYFLKNFLYLITVIFIFASCASKSNLDTSKDVVPADTASLYNSSMLTDTGTIIETSAVPKGSLPAYTKRTPSGSHNTGTGTRSSGTASSGNGTSTSSSGTGQTTTAKKGWSKAAKGAVIGAGTGAIAGAIISKKKGKGAIIGGVVGAAGGYIIGRSKDKKDGRVR